MKKFLVMLSFGVMLLASPALSHAAFVNYSGVVTKASASFINLNFSGALQSSPFNVSAVPATTKNTAVEIDTSAGQLEGVSYFPGGLIDFVSIYPMFKKGNGLTGNVAVIAEFYSWPITYDPSPGTYTGSGEIYISEAGATCSYVQTSATAGVLTIGSISPWVSFYEDVAAGVVNPAQNPLVMKSLVIPPIKLIKQP